MRRKPFLTAAMAALAGLALACRPHEPAGLVPTESPRPGATAPAGQTPVGAGRSLVEGARFAMNGGRSLWNYVATETYICASFDYVADVGTHPTTRAPRREQRWALLAWTPDGRKLWQKDYPRAFRLVAAGDRVALMYQEVTPQLRGGIIWIDATTGKELWHVKFSRVPTYMCYYPQERMLVAIVRSPTINTRGQGAWMDVLAFDADGRQAWTWRYRKCADLDPARMDGRTLVLVPAYASQPAIVRLDVATGREVWRVPWDCDKPVEKFQHPRQAPRALVALVPVKGPDGVVFLDMTDGTVAWSAPAPPDSRRVWTTDEPDRVYLTGDPMKGKMLAACGYPSGKLIWTDQTATASYAGPVAWGPDVVIVMHRVLARAVGNNVQAELRVYARDGTLKGHRPSNDPDNADQALGYTLRPVPVGDRLYVATLNAVVALRRPADFGLRKHFPTGRLNLALVGGHSGITVHWALPPKLVGPVVQRIGSPGRVSVYSPCPGKVAQLLAPGITVPQVKLYRGKDMEQYLRPSGSPRVRRDFETAVAGELECTPLGTDKVRIVLRDLCFPSIAFTQIGPIEVQLDVPPAP